jgi:hypothetical protein
MVSDFTKSHYDHMAHHEQGGQSHLPLGSRVPVRRLVCSSLWPFEQHAMQRIGPTRTRRILPVSKR